MKHRARGLVPSKPSFYISDPMAVGARVQFIAYLVEVLCPAVKRVEIVE